MLSPIRRSVADVDGSISLEFNTLARQVDDSLVKEHVLATLSCFFGGLALRAVRTIKLVLFVQLESDMRQT